MTQTMDDTTPQPGDPAGRPAEAATPAAPTSDPTTSAPTPTSDATTSDASGEAPTVSGWASAGDGAQRGDAPTGTDGPPPFGGWAPPGAGGWDPSGGGQPRPTRLRRSREDRVAVGLAGGLGRYFRVDPVIFRVIFGVLALFGGSGIVLYLLGWAAIPDEDTVQAPVDRAIAALRRWHVPISLVIGVGLVVVWLAFFSWWAPSSFIPAVALVVVIVLFLMRGGSPIRAGDPIARPVPARPEFTAPPPTPAGEPAAGSELRSWFQESRAHARARRRRRRPVLVAAWIVLLAVVGGLALTDSLHGVPFGLYFWAIGAIVLAALVVGAVLRRTPWILIPLLLPAFVGVVVFGNSPVSAHDGWGDRAWNPAAGGLQPQYRAAFGRGTLDLTGLGAPTVAESTNVRMGAGQVRVIVPGSLAVVVTADVHFGDVSIGGVSANSGANFTDTYLSPAARAHPDAPRLAVHVRLSSGQLELIYVK